MLPHHETPLDVNNIVIGAIKEAVFPLDQTSYIWYTAPCLKVERNANRRRGSAWWSTCKRYVKKEVKYEE